MYTSQSADVIVVAVNLQVVLSAHAFEHIFSVLVVVIVKVERVGGGWPDRACVRGRLTSLRVCLPASRVCRERERERERETVDIKEKSRW